METIRIQIKTIEEALHLQNIATINIGKYQKNPVLGAEHMQSSMIRLWRDVHYQAGVALHRLSKV
ncbi:hypothetical protein JKJ11_24180 [Vibrio sp. SCSIO 43133]|uniref:hypothetical protein n=1 Tax=Vibrio sp. SCSIO 43133 TaxID=2802577 RepID=UPI002075BC8A|nr:hypothetical protein [Vibrio sp. SCSIO 43133]USE02746.1 hypothetical protein JKJ11_24180 [Vibrio sp. SCSIO 43133]